MIQHMVLISAVLDVQLSDNGLLQYDLLTCFCIVFQGYMLCNVANKIEFEFEFESKFMDISCQWQAVQFQYRGGGVSVQGGLCLGVSVQGVSVQGGLCPRVSVREIPSPHGQTDTKKRAMISRPKNAIEVGALEESVGAAVDVAMSKYSLEDLKTKDTC